MYAKNATREQLITAANNCDVLINIERRSAREMFTIRMAPGQENYRKMSRQINGKSRRTNSVCLHGHYWFFKELFAIAPDAIVESSWMGKIKHTKETLDDNYENMRHIMVRQWDGLMADDECLCTEEMK